MAKFINSPEALVLLWGDEEFVRSVDSIPGGPRYGYEFLKRLGACGHQNCVPLLGGVEAILCDYRPTRWEWKTLEELGILEK